jgi:butyryl-CoA dehydrogenase
MLLKRAQRGQLGLVEAVKRLQSEILSGPQTPEPVSGLLGEEVRMVANAKKIGLLALGIAYQKFMDKIEQQQEVMANITEILMNTYALESAVLRTQKIALSGKSADQTAEMTQVFAREAMDIIELSARNVLAACSEGDALRMNLSVLKRYTKCEPVDLIGLRRSIAARLIQAEKYVV